MVLKHNVLAMAIASVCLGVCATAYAGTAPSASQQQGTQDQAQPSSTDKNSKDTDGKRNKAQKMQAVEVNGFVSSIENSTALKRNASSIVEAVSAEQVGKLPGVSIADTLGRLPGLAVPVDAYMIATTSARIG